MISGDGSRYSPNEPTRAYAPRSVLPRMSTSPAGVDVRGNGLGYLEMAVSLDLSDFQQVAWKYLQHPVGNKGRRHFQMFGTPTPKGAASTGRRRPTRAVETPERSRVPKQTVVGTCPGLTDVASERNRSIVRTWRNTSIKDTANCAQRVGRPPQVQSTAHPDVRHDDRRWSSRWRSLSRVQRQESAPAAILLL